MSERTGEFSFQQRGKLRQVVAHFHNRPAVPPLPGSVPAAAPREPEDSEAAAAGRQSVPAAVPRLFVHLQFKRLWRAHVGRLPSLEWNVGVSEALECDNGAVSQV